MTTADFLLAAMLVFVVQEVGTRLGKPLILRDARQQLDDLARDQSEQHITRTLPIIANAIFALLFAFFLFHYREKAGDIGLWSGCLYGFLAGVLAYFPQSLLQIAFFARGQAFQLRQAAVGVVVSLVAGAASSFLL